METFDNFEEFAEDHPQLAQELLRKVEKGDWQKNEINYYEDVSDFADYQICKGVYADILNRDLSDTDYCGKPSLYNYIDLDSLGSDLLHDYDKSRTFVTDEYEVIETKYGWTRKIEDLKAQIDQKLSNDNTDYFGISRLLQSNELSLSELRNLFDDDYFGYFGKDTLRKIFFACTTNFQHYWLSNNINDFWYSVDKEEAKELAKRKISSVHYNDTNCNVDGQWFTTQWFTDDVEYQKQTRSDQQEAINRSKYFFALTKSSEKMSFLNVYDDDKYLADNLYAYAIDRDYSFAEFLRVQKEKDN
ncbi:MAG: hypothetical protein N4R51_05300 [Lactobacillus crispatus]|nr:hypothetical protein [Lactobacillus crispatus]